MPASILSDLNDNAGGATALLTAVLIAVTAYYAWQNRRMVGETQATRELAILPKLALEMHGLGPTAMTVAVRNVGPGPALRVDVRLVYEPLNAGSPPAESRWRRNVLSPTEQFDFMPPGDLNNNLNTLPAAFKAIRLVGEMKDASGRAHMVDERFEDLPARREMLGGANQRWTAADPERRFAEELHKKFEPLLRALQK